MALGTPASYNPVDPNQFLVALFEMSAGVYTLGLNHVSAPVALRERVSLSDELVKPALESLKAAFGGSVQEAAVLSTCNRTELYCAADRHNSAGIWRNLLLLHGFSPGDRPGHLVR